MSKNDWEDLLKEPVSESLKARTLARARAALEEDKASAPVFSFQWLIPLFPALALLLVFIRQQETVTTANENEMAMDMQMMDELAEMSSVELAELDTELLENLELIEDLDVLEEWDG